MTSPEEELIPHTGRTLILLRHGKSGYPDGVGDHDRPLADRGEVEAAEAGRWIRLHQPVINEVICSTAVRTRATLAATRVPAPVRYASEIYEASPGDVLEQIAATDSDINTLMIVGHAPGLPDLALMLALPESDLESVALLQTRFPTSALAVFQVPGGWSELAATGAILTAFHIARR